MALSGEVKKGGNFLMHLLKWVLIGSAVLGFYNFIFAPKIVPFIQGLFTKKTT
jgi:hypothetical protein